MTEVLTPEQRFLRRAWLLEQLPVYAAEAAYHRTHEKAENQIVYMLWRLDSPRGSLSLGAPRVDWEVIGERLRDAPVPNEVVAALLAVLVLNDYRGATPDFAYGPGSKITMSWPLVGIDFKMTVHTDRVELDYGDEGHSEHWTHQAVKDAFERVRKASSVVS